LIFEEEIRNEMAAMSMIDWSKINLEEVKERWTK